ncbi:hypothetical protein SPD48_05115 [Pseudogracilibacillus sp. SE30717A]|uniref:hypothetical protein n=1 Tax=Pseudogracilibacillus sp. SE30717A TaxID=3098293 RepID=UPI00300DD2C9
MNNFHQLLKNLHSLEGPFPIFDTTIVSSTPNELFSRLVSNCYKNGVMTYELNMRDYTKKGYAKIDLSYNRGGIW